MRHILLPLVFAVGTDVLSFKEDHHTLFFLLFGKAGALLKIVAPTGTAGTSMRARRAATLHVVAQCQAPRALQDARIYRAADVLVQLGGPSFHVLSIGLLGGAGDHLSSGLQVVALGEQYPSGLTRKECLLNGRIG